MVLYWQNSLVKIFCKLIMARIWKELNDLFHVSYQRILRLWNKLYTFQLPTTIKKNCTNVQMTCFLHTKKWYFRLILFLFYKIKNEFCITFSRKTKFIYLCACKSEVSTKSYKSVTKLGHIFKRARAATKLRMFSMLK